MKFSNEKEFEQVNVFGKGEPNVAYAKYFIGDSFLNPVTSAGCGVHLSNVTFAPGCRNNWAAVSCCSALQARAGIRKRASPPSAWCPAPWWRSRPM